jgi:hypothetical protein
VIEDVKEDCVATLFSSIVMDPSEVIIEPYRMPRDASFGALFKTKSLVYKFTWYEAMHLFVCMYVCVCVCVCVFFTPCFAVKIH